LNNRQGLVPIRIVDEHFYSRRLLAALARAAVKMSASVIAELEGVAASKALWLALPAKRLIWAVRAQKLLERELPFSKYMFLRHLSSLYCLEVILSDAFDSEHTSYVITNSKCSLCL
jgi:hypothetical protein